MTSDGFANLFDSETLAPLAQPKKLHNLPISNVVFREDSNMLITSGLDYKYKFVPLSSFSAVREMKRLLTYIAIMILILLYLVDYLV